MKRRTFLSFGAIREPPQSFSLSGLADASDEELALTRPGVPGSAEIVVEDGMVTAKAGASRRAPLFAFDDDAALAVFNQFDGRRTLAEIARDRAQATGESFGDSLHFVTSLARKFYRDGVCVPTDPGAPA